MISHSKNCTGFTLVELIVVIVITGIIAGIVAIFILKPVQGYVDLTRRAEMADVADLALRRIKRDIHLALPNSVRVSTSNLALEFLSAPVGGRYRKIPDGGTDALSFDQPDTTFDILGPAVAMQASDEIVIFNLGIPGANAYEGNTADTHVRRAYNGAAGMVNNIVMTSTARLPLESPQGRFYAVREPVSYICDPATGELRRYWGYAISAAQSETFDPSVANALIAKNLSSCAFSYNANAVSQRVGLVTLQLNITQAGESIRLYHATHVSNIP